MTMSVRTHFWNAIFKRPLLAACLPIGMNLPGGIVYAGISPSSHKPFFVTRTDDPLKRSWDDAASTAEENGYRLPTPEEALHLKAHKNEIGNFESSVGTAYWTNVEREGHDNEAVLVNFNRGRVSPYMKKVECPVRYVIA